MKQSHNPERIKALIKGHETQRQSHEKLAAYHNERITYWEDYLKELTRPGFRYSRRDVTISIRDRGVIALNTWKWE